VIASAAMGAGREQECARLEDGAKSGGRRGVAYVARQGSAGAQAWFIAASTHACIVSMHLIPSRRQREEQNTH